LNPSLRVGAQLIETTVIHRGISRRQATGAACDMLAELHVPDP
jgi:ABC-type microcin C transport system duplicated ATPase subunit YejF